MAASAQKLETTIYASAQKGSMGKIVTKVSELILILSSLTENLALTIAISFISGDHWSTSIDNRASSGYIWPNLQQGYASLYCRGQP